MDSSLLSAIVWGVVRFAAAYAAGHGINIASAEWNAVADAALVIGSLVGTVYQKVKVGRAIQDAKIGPSK